MRQGQRDAHMRPFFRNGVRVPHAWPVNDAREHLGFVTSDCSLYL